MIFGRRLKQHSPRLCERFPERMKLAHALRAVVESEYHCLTNSTRRFLAFPASLSLEATGASGPTP